MSILKVALLQLSGCGRDLEESLAKGERWCRRAAEAGAHLALFPEMWSIGYQGFDPARAGEHESWLALAQGRDARFVRRFAGLAAELGMAIAVSYLERGAPAPRNVCVLFDRSGREALHYAKAHLCPWGPPDAACAPGDAFPVCTLDTAAGPVRVGAMICFDREFPEAARLLMLAGAELVLVPNACELGPRAPEVGDVRLAQLRGRAFENLVAVAMANYAAPSYDGHSFACYPDGSTIVLADEEEQLVLAPVDLARVRAFRSAEAGRDAARRPELYRAIADPGRARPLLPAAHERGTGSES